MTESFMGVETETDFERVSVIQYKDNVGRVRVTLDPNYPTASVRINSSTMDRAIGNSTTEIERVDIGSVMTTPEAPHVYNSTQPEYEFRGWYTTPDGWKTGEGEPFSETDRIWKRVTYYANWENLDEHVVTLNANGGDVATSSVYVEENNSFTLPVPTRAGYAFLGWYTSYNGEEIRLTDEAGNSISSWYIEQDITAYASWGALYDITLDLRGGYLPNNESNLQIAVGAYYTIPVPAREHYQFTGWYTSYSGEEIRLTTATGYSINSWYIEQDTTVYAKWEAIEYSIAYELNGGTNADANPSSYTIDILNNEGNIIFESPTKDIIRYSSSMNINGETTYVSTSYTFDGWYLNADFSGESVATLSIVMDNITLYAKWNENDTTIATTTKSYLRIDSSNGASDTGEYILFGSYPQTEVTDSIITAALNGMRGTLPTSSNSYDWTSYGYYIEGNVTNFMWYIDIEYSDEKYRGVYFTSYRPGQTIAFVGQGSDQDDNGYCTGMVYWFKYEPIKWRILTESDGKAMILSELILDSQQYDYESGKEENGNNNYAESTIRAWLNDTFYNTAFSAMQQAIIETTEVDNSSYSTGDSSNQDACENTFDKVFLLSYREAVNTSYGFSTDSWNSSATRQKMPTNYCLAQGGTVGWQLRSPFDRSYFPQAWLVSGAGSIGTGDRVCNTQSGIVPALVISL